MRAGGDGKREDEEGRRAPREAGRARQLPRRLGRRRSRSSVLFRGALEAAAAASRGARVARVLSRSAPPGWRSGTRCGGSARRSAGPTPSSGRPSAPRTLCKPLPSVLLYFFGVIFSLDLISSILPEILSHFLGTFIFRFLFAGLCSGFLCTFRPFQLDLPSRQVRARVGKILMGIFLGILPNKGALPLEKLVSETFGGASNLLEHVPKELARMFFSTWGCARA